MDYILRPSNEPNEAHIEHIQLTHKQYPEVYGDKLPLGVKYDRSKILFFEKDKIIFDNLIDDNGQAISDPTNTAQLIRAQGNPEEQELKLGLKSPGGYDIRQVRGRIKMYQDARGHYQFIDGRTKTRIMKELGHKSFIACIYKVKNMSLVRLLGNKFNQKTFAAGVTSIPDIEKNIKADIREECLILADQEVEDNYDPNHQTLVVEARKHGGTTYKTPTYLKIAHNVLKENQEEDVRINYTETTAEAKLEQMGIYTDNLNNNGIYYFICSASTIAKSWINAARKAYALKKAFLNKDDNTVTNFKELRVIFHSGQIHSSDFLNSAKQIIDNARKEWNEISNAVSSAFFHDTNPSTKVVLYGCFPFSKKMGYDLNKIISFTKPYTDKTLNLTSKHQEPIYFLDIDAA